MSVNPVADQIVVVPCNGSGGLDADLDPHFGYCPAYTLLDLRRGCVYGVRTLPGLPHVNGDCLAPVRYLLAGGATTLITWGMGRRPLLHCRENGIAVYRSPGVFTVASLIKDYCCGNLLPFSLDNVCTGCTPEEQA